MKLLGMSHGRGVLSSDSVLYDIAVPVRGVEGQGGDCDSASSAAGEAASSYEKDAESFSRDAHEGDGGNDAVGESQLLVL